MRILGQSIADINQWLRASGKSEVHAGPIFRRLYRDPEASLPSSVESMLHNSFDFSKPRRVSAYRSRYDASVKFVIELSDCTVVEAVLMPEVKRTTLCLSSQVGCAQGCRFCHTARMGLVRNLQADEIVGQVLCAMEWIQENPDWLEESGLEPRTGITNIVFMGMGEPLDNVESVAKAISIMTQPHGLAIGLRRISVSTAGHLPGLRRIVEINPRIPIALSVHAARPAIRSRLMPIDRRWPLEEVVSFLKETYGCHQSRMSLLVQYTVIADLNDSLDDAKALLELLSNLRYKVNLIPFNSFATSRFRSPNPEMLSKFRDYLHEQGARVMVRYSKGQDIAAACGQLIVNA